MGSGSKTIFFKNKTLNAVLRVSMKFFFSKIKPCVVVCHESVVVEENFVDDFHGLSRGLFQLNEIAGRTVLVFLPPRLLANLSQHVLVTEINLNLKK